MKKALVVVLLLALVLGVFAAPAAVAKKKKKKKAQPVATTLFMDGKEQFGEVESSPLVAEGFLQLTATEPAGSTKSHGVMNYGVGPNTKCAGNTFFPVFVGNLAGTITGDIKVTFAAQATPGAQVDVRIWPDVAALACNDEYPEPAREVRVALPAGQGTVEAVLTGADITPVSSVMVQISPATIDVAGTQRPLPPFFARIFYGSKDSGSSLQFNCLPIAPATSCAS